MPAKDNTNLGLAAYFQANTLLADRNPNRIRLEAVFSMLYGKSALVVFVYNFCRLGIKRGNIGVLAGFKLFLVGIGYGYRNFENFRKHILLCFG